MLGVVAQFFNVAAQVCTWTFLIQYVQQALDGSLKLGGYLLQVSLLVFLASRFLMTWIIGKVRATFVMAILAALAVVLCIFAMFSPNAAGVAALVGLSFCLSLMFPTIYGVALQGLGPATKYGAAGLVMAIVGGAIMPLIQGRILDVTTRRSPSSCRRSASPSSPCTPYTISSPLRPQPKRCPHEASLAHHPAHHASGELRKFSTESGLVGGNQEPRNHVVEIIGLQYPALDVLLNAFHEPSRRHCRRRHDMRRRQQQCRLALAQRYAERQSPRCVAEAFVGARPGRMRQTATPPTSAR